jgi:DNA-binding response OmpR family regulator
LYSLHLAGLTGAQEKNTMDKPKILIVDDDADLRHGLNLRLRASHFDTAYATDGFSAIAMAQKERPDLIILDIGLPAGDGFIVLDRLQQNATLSVIPVIVLTARDPQHNRERALKAGARAFLQKPADNNELMDMIRTTLHPAWPGTTVSAQSDR